MTCSFDCNGCLVDDKEEPIKENVELLKLLSKRYRVFVWSGNGFKYAFTIAEKLKLFPYISGVLDKYDTIEPDLAFDDQPIKLGKVNICTK